MFVKKVGTRLHIARQQPLRRTLVRLINYSTASEPRRLKGAKLHKGFVFLCLFVSLWFNSFAQSKATWIWYPGDYEIWLSNNMQNRRTDRETFFPVFWKVDSHYPLMDFHKEFTLSQPELSRSMQRESIT
jgi:alpha-L-rhamnosidase